MWSRIKHNRDRNKISFPSEGDRFRRMGSSAGMKLIVDLPEACAADMGIDLGGGYLAVAQHQLY